MRETIGPVSVQAWLCSYKLGLKLRILYVFILELTLESVAYGGAQEQVNEDATEWKDEGLCLVLRIWKLLFLL